MSMNAQVFKVSAEANGIGSDAVDVEAGKVWGSIEGALDISNPFATQHKAVDCKNNDFNKVVIDGNEIETKDGIQGQDNPKDADGGNSALTFKEATGGAVIQIDVRRGRGGRPGGARKVHQITHTSSTDKEFQDE